MLKQLLSRNLMEILKPGYPRNVGPWKSFQVNRSRREERQWPWLSHSFTSFHRECRSRSSTLAIHISDTACNYSGWLIPRIYHSHHGYGIQYSGCKGQRAVWRFCWIRPATPYDQKNYSVFNTCVLGLQKNPWQVGSSFLWTALTIFFYSSTFLDYYLPNIIIQNTFKSYIICNFIFAFFYKTILTYYFSGVHYLQGMQMIFSWVFLIWTLKYLI